MKQYVKEKFNDFLNFGVNHAKISTDEQIKFTMKDFLDLPHFDDVQNCYNLMAALESNDEFTIDGVSGDNIYITDVDAAGATINYGDLTVQFDKYDLIAQLNIKCNMMSEKKKPTQSKKDDNMSNSILSFLKFFKLNKVTQHQHLKSADEYANEHTDGDIYKIS